MTCWITQTISYWKNIIESLGLVFENFNNRKSQNLFFLSLYFPDLMHFQFRNLKTDRVTLAWSMEKFSVLPYYTFNVRKTMAGKYMQHSAHSEWVIETDL